LKTNEWIMMTIGTSSPRVKGMNQSTLGSAGEGHGHTKGDLEAWRRHHSGPPWIVGFLVSVL